MSLECERHHGKVPVAELIDYLLPFVSQARKGGEAVVAGCLQGEAYVLERERKANWAESRRLAMRCSLAACQADTSGLPARLP